MGLVLVTLLLALCPVALFVGHVLLAHGAALLASELTAAADLALATLLAAPRLALSLLAALPLARLAALSLLAVLLAASRVSLLGLLAAPLPSTTVLAALGLGLSALLQAVSIAAGLRLAITQFALHPLLLSSVLLATLRDATALLLAAMLRRCPLLTPLGAAARPSLLPSASLALLAVALLALPLTALLTPPLTTLALVRLLALSSALIGIVLVGRLATPLAVALPRSLELPAALGAPSSSLPLALELGLSPLLGLARVFAAAVSGIASIVPFVLSASALGTPVSVAHGNRTLDRHSAVNVGRGLPESAEDDPVDTSPVSRLNAANRSHGRRWNARVTTVKGHVTSAAWSRAGGTTAAGGSAAGQETTTAGRPADHDTAGTISSSQSRKNASYASASGFTWWIET